MKKTKNGPKEGWTMTKNIPQEIKEEIVLFWRTSKDNASKTIADKYGCTVNNVNTIIDNHLKNKQQFGNSEQFEKE
jgi:hypothetical protein